MKNIRLLAFLAVFPSILSAATLFQEDFENGLSFDNWVGKDTGPHNGVIVPDPIEKDSALSFNALTISGDMFSKEVSNPSGKYTLSFDYLGKKETGSVADNFGGFIGYSLDTPGKHVWLAGTKSDYPDIKSHLLDTGTWQHVTISFTGETNIRIMLEDALGVFGDAYFDNILLTDDAGTESTCPTNSQAKVSSSNLDIHLPSIIHQSPLGDQNLKVDLEYKGKDSKGQHIWGLKSFSVNK
ncbi:MAG: hypothetical protein KAH20_14565 [Methylococcales bacterium]|nr:hypothetical protein [Methylococcales bacterium]